MLYKTTFVLKVYLIFEICMQISNTSHKAMAYIKTNILNKTVSIYNCLNHPTYPIAHYKYINKQIRLLTMYVPTHEHDMIVTITHIETLDLKIRV